MVAYPLGWLVAATSIPAGYAAFNQIPPYTTSENNSSVEVVEATVIASSPATAVAGASNAAPVHLRELFEQAQVRPVAVQNRCFARSGWDRDMRVLCAEQGVAYQGLSLLTANRDVRDQSTVRHIAGTHAVTPAQIVFALARGIGMVALTGTSTDTHMGQDLAAVHLALDADELAAIEAVIAR